MRAWWRGAVTALVLALALQTAAAKTLPELVKDLGDKDYAVRLAAYRALLARPDPAAAILLGKAFPGYDHASRTYAKVILDRLPIEKTRALFRSLLRSEDPELRALGAASLFVKGDVSGVEIAAKALRDPKHTDTIAYHIMVRLVYVRHPLVSRAALERLRTAASVTLIRQVMTHVNYTGDRQAVPDIERLTTSKDIEVRLRARGLLFRLGRADVVPDLAVDLADPKGSYTALNDVLVWLGRGPKPPDVVSKALLTRLESEGQPLTVSRILETLADWGYRPAIEVAKPYLDDPDARVARAAFGLIARLAGRPQIDALRRSLRSKVPLIRVLAAEALRRFDDTSGLSVVIAELGEDDVEARREAARVLGDFRMQEAVPALVDALEDADSAVRSQAWSSLMRTLPALFPYRRFDLNGLGYAASAPAPARAKAVAALRAWWAALPK
jgi:HEAT repeat protein